VRGPNQDAALAAEGMQMVEKYIPSGAKARVDFASIYGTTEVVP
jgi:hypothetical protein